MRQILVLVILATCACAVVTRAGVDTPPAIAGSISSRTIQSQVLDEERDILVALPAGYDTGNERYPVVYVLDAGWHFLSAVAASRFLAETSYITAHRIPPLILVGIVNHDRDHDDTPTQCASQHGMSFPTSGGGDRFLDFMRDELLPYVDANFRTHSYRVLCGWSLGGLLTIHALIDRPDIFDGHIAISPSLWWDERVVFDRAVALAANGEARQRDLVLTIGTAEEGGLCYNAVHDLVECWKATPPDGLAFSFIEIADEDHNHSPYKAYFDGLRALFADWFYPEQAFAAGLDSLQQHYSALSARRGYTIPIPGHLYSALARQFLADDRPDDAVTVHEAQCASNPGSAMAFFDLGETCRKARQDDRARDAYLRALELERAAAAPDTVFINWVKNVISGLEEKR